MHVPRDHADKARSLTAESNADSIISVGGGSTVGLAKTVALTTGLPIVAVPTTYAGSEATAVWGITDKRTKNTGTDLRVLPKAVVYDPELVATLPRELATASALNALAHCIDSLWAPRADPINRAHALEGARLLRDGLDLLHDNETHAEEQLLAGCYLAALSFSSAGSGIHHKICHVLGGTFSLPHAQTHAVVLPHVLALNESAGAPAVARLAEVFQTDTASAGLADLYSRIEAPRHLSDLGFSHNDIPEACQRILSVAPPNNLAELTEDNLAELLHNAL